eukprot:m.10385 g.10385  ORF g.10385 m.10385 type:complete len:460 (+) comp4314_c0_seq1:116-1495(+)
MLWCAARCNRFQMPRLFSASNSTRCFHQHQRERQPFSNLANRRVMLTPRSRFRRALCVSATTGHQTPQLVLGIESSFDDTGVGVVDSSGQVKSDVRICQREHHVHTGGTVPRVAGQLHAASLPEALDAAMREAGIEIDELAAVACTVGPGLAPCLSAGLNFARAFCQSSAKPMLPVHHMEAHALTARLTAEAPLPFPFLVLLASGGHCLLLICENVSTFRRLGTTLDDAPGEAFDKVSRAVGLPVGGAELERAAASGDPSAFRFTVPLSSTRSCDFSFAGLKSAVLREVDRQCSVVDPTWSSQLESVRLTSIERAQLTSTVMQRPEMAHIRSAIAASFQRAVCHHIAARTHRAILYCQRHYDLSGLVLSGGVACNEELRVVLTRLAAEYTLQTIVPPPRLCTDNGVMIAWNGVEKLRAGEAGLQGEALSALKYTPKWPLGLDCSANIVGEQIKVPKLKF